MQKNRLTQLNSYLFDQIEVLSKSNLTPAQLKKEIEKANVLSKLASQVIGIHKVVVDASKSMLVDKKIPLAFRLEESYIHTIKDQNQIEPKLSLTLEDQIYQIIEKENLPINSQSIQNQLIKLGIQRNTSEITRILYKFQYEKKIYKKEGLTPTHWAIHEEPIVSTKKQIITPEIGTKVKLVYKYMNLKKGAIGWIFDNPKKSSLSIIFENGNYYVMTLAEQKKYLKGISFDETLASYKYEGIINFVNDLKEGVLKHLDF